MRLPGAFVARHALEQPARRGHLLIEFGNRRIGDAHGEAPGKRISRRLRVGRGLESRDDATSSPPGESAAMTRPARHLDATEARTRTLVARSAALGARGSRRPPRTC